MGKIFEQIISSKIVQIANKHLKRFSTPLIITEMKILSQQGMITHSLTEKVCQTRGGSEWTRTLIYLGMKMIQLWRDVKWCNYFGKGRSGVFFIKVKIHIPYDPAILHLLGIHQEKLKYMSTKKLAHKFSPCFNFNSLTLETARKSLSTGE